MYKATIFYFSGTGNTWWVSDKIEKQLNARNINAEAVSIDSLTDGCRLDTKKADWLIKSSDLLFFGWPIYGSDLPEPMKKFIDTLNPLEKEKHVHTFCTQMYFSGDGAWLYHKNFEAKNLKLDSCAHFLMPSNVSIWHGAMGPPKTQEKTDKILSKCEKAIEKHINSLLDGKAGIKGKRSYPIGIMQRGPYRAFYKRFQDWMGVDTSLCTKCGLCAELCPSCNISLKEYPEFSGHCALCFRCYAMCPVSAVTVRGKTHDKSKHGLPYRIPDKRFNKDLLKPKSK